MRKEGWHRAARSSKASTGGRSSLSWPRWNHVALDWPVQAHNLHICHQREAHCTLANVDSSVEMAKVEPGKRIYLGKVMFDGCDQEGIGLSTLVEY